MKAKQQARWGRIRQKGRLHFVLVYGAGYWGISVAVVTTVANYLFVDNSFPKLDTLISKLVASILCGLFVGLVIWFKNQDDYEDAIDAESERE